MKVTLLTLIIALLAAGVFWRQSRDLTHRLQNANQTISQQKAQLSAQADVLKHLNYQAERNEQAQVELRQQLVAMNQLAHKRHQTITRLLNENASLRHWYQSVLPDDVIRLHNRPAFANPTNYLRWLSESDKLRNTGQPTSHQR